MLTTIPVIAGDLQASIDAFPGNSRFDATVNLLCGTYGTASTGYCAIKMSIIGASNFTLGLAERAGNGTGARVVFTGSSGNTDKGSLITYSGGARG